MFNCRCSVASENMHLYLGRLGAVSMNASMTFVFIHRTYSQDSKPELPHHLGHTDHLFIRSYEFFIATVFVRYKAERQMQSCPSVF